jgi:hypothetical protein
MRLVMISMCNHINVVSSCRRRGVHDCAPSRGRWEEGEYGPIETQDFSEDEDENHADEDP